MDDPLPKNVRFHIQVMLEEYRALRAEMMQSMQNRNSILSFGSATLGGIASATALSATTLNDYFIVLVYMIIIPLLSLCILNFWLAEMIRIIRASVYIREHIETKINDYLGYTLLWESYVRVPCGKPCPIRFEAQDFKVDDVEQIFYIFIGITYISFLGALAYIVFTLNVNLTVRFLFLLVTIIMMILISSLFRRSFNRKVKKILKHCKLDTCNQC